MKETVCMMLAIFAALGVLMLTGAMIEGGASVTALVGLAVCALATRGFYRISIRPARPSRRVGAARGEAKKACSLRAA